MGDRAIAGTERAARLRRHRLTDSPLRIAILALGGQGGGVLSRWIVGLAEANGWRAQATSVPGVAQRTGTTIYYVEIAPPSEQSPVMALMPASGDVDIVIAAEFMEAGRALSRGFVEANRTTLIASSHRIFSIGEKSAMGDGRVSAANVLEALQKSSNRLMLADFAAVAEQAGAPISSALFGALAGSGALPFAPCDFEAAIEDAGMMSPQNRAGFEAGCAIAGERRAGKPVALADIKVRPRSPSSDPSATIPAPVAPLHRLGEERMRDYYREPLADLYRQRMAAVIAADRALGGETRDFALSVAATRHLALWMTYEDVYRVADLKTRPGRITRIEAEARAKPGQIVEVTEFMHPRFEEVCESLPRSIGTSLRNSPRGREMFDRFLGKGRFIRTTGALGFTLLWLIARAGRWRTGTLRWSEEQQRIEAWLQSALNAAREDYDLGVQIIKLQRLVKGYGDTHARGLRNYATIMTAIGGLRGQPDAAAKVNRLQEAALADEDGIKLRQALEVLLPQQPGVQLGQNAEQRDFARSLAS